ncbi:hypothetical protein FA95DRAFT_817460 [Auriscalpium vulgare]|uniref:Uncharacterized protein n=1 Tax=Auriscalpium vulgare TaxID=40419 RepID=A0ACB8S1K2_9AGAM|nr:hypothetical protein FA95DRAFT_817460 [Auriscalpium vulgare]
MQDADRSPSPELDPDDAAKSAPKPPVVRGARACTVCRAAKMKCVGAEDGGQQPCQRCKRTGVECIFEKHRRGRKPGSKLSEASKMLRRLEKGLNNAKLKQAANASASPPASEPRTGRAESSKHRNRPGPYDSPRPFSNELPPLNIPPNFTGEVADSRRISRAMEHDQDDDDDPDGPDEGMFPATLIRRENRRHSFFKTILNPEQEQAGPSTRNERANSSASTLTNNSLSSAPPLLDPVASGIVDEANAKVLFDLVFLRLNPFINLFDPALHSPSYVRSKSPFLFTTLVMAGCKFFKPESFKACQKLAHEFAVRAFAESWKSVEVVQAFACLMYWKEPEDTVRPLTVVLVFCAYHPYQRTWTFIGYACRMAVELGLNRYYSTPPPGETEFQRSERRNRERTYLVLFVHDRSLSMQTGRQWMLPEVRQLSCFSALPAHALDQCDLVRHSSTWHEEGGSPFRPEDVIVAAFVQLRRISAETTDVFYLHKGVAGSAVTHMDVNKEVLLRNCNGKLTQWMDSWQHEMRRANGETFHMAFLSFFRLHVRLFLNSFGIQASMSPQSHQMPSLQALSACYTSAMENLGIVANEFHQMSMLRYGQDSITVMTAYSAVFLLKLLRSSKTLAELQDGATAEVHVLISKTADAYEEASHLSSACTGAAYHARFLRALVAQDIFKSATDHGPSLTRSQSAYSGAGLRNAPIAPQRRQTASSTSSSSVASPPPQSIYQPPGPMQMIEQESQQHFRYAGGHEPMQVEPVPSMRTPGYASAYAPQQQQQQPQQQQQHAHAHAHGQAPPQPVPGQPLSDDMRYWNNMFRELGFGDNVDSSATPGGPPAGYGGAAGMQQGPAGGPGAGAGGGIAAGAGVNVGAPPPGPNAGGSVSGYNPPGRTGGTPYSSQYAYHHMNSNAPGYGM